MTIYPGATAVSGVAVASSPPDVLGTPLHFTTAAVASTDQTFTVESGSNTVMIVKLAYEDAGPVTSVVWDAAGANEALTALVQKNNAGTNAWAEIWYRLSPTPGASKLVTIDPPGLIPFIGRIEVREGAKQAAPLFNSSETDGPGLTSSSVSVDLSTGDNDPNTVLSDVLASTGENTGWTATNPHAEEFQSTDGGTPQGTGMLGAHVAGGTGSQACAWTRSSQNIFVAHAVAAIQPA
jgi:hypothetical protein